MKYYCTITDVLAVATDYRRDVETDSTISGSPAQYELNTETITQAEVEEIIYEASEIVRKIIQPRYDPDVIDAYDPDYPPVIVYLTQYQAAVMMYQRYGTQNVERSRIMIAVLRDQVRLQRMIIENGALVDINGNVITTLGNPSVLTGASNTEFPATGKMEKLYKYGRTY